MIHLSATAIKDYLSCPRKVYYRVNHPDSAISTKEMALGNVVHSVLETSWRNYSLAQEEAVVQIKKHNLRSGVEKVHKCIYNFFEMFEGIVGEDDVIEELFSLPYKDDVVLRGKMDRIHNNVVYDWKTGDREPDDVSKDIQFIVYWLAYKKLYGKEPSAVTYVSLPLKRIFVFEPDPVILREFEYSVLPEVIENLRKNKFHRSGLYGYRVCNNCSYQNICHGELGLE